MTEIARREQLLEQKYKALRELTKEHFAGSSAGNDNSASRSRGRGNFDTESTFFNQQKLSNGLIGPV